MKIFRFLIIASLISAQSFGDDNGNKKFKFSKVMAVPDLTFLNNVYTGLDILEQMDFEPLKNTVDYHRPLQEKMLDFHMPDSYLYRQEKHN